MTEKYVLYARQCVSPYNTVFRVLVGNAPSFPVGRIFTLPMGDSNSSYLLPYVIRGTKTADPSWLELVSEVSYVGGIDGSE
jgi:hypothetical protein